MKKLLSLILCLAMCLSACFALVACGETENNEDLGGTPQIEDPYKKQHFGESFGIVVRNFEINTGDSVGDLKVLELYVSQNEDGSFTGGGIGELALNGYEEGTMEAALVLLGDRLYVKVETENEGEVGAIYMDYDFNKILELVFASADVDLEAIIDYANGELEGDVEAINDWVENKFLPALGDLSAYELSEEDMAAICAFFTLFGDKFIKVEKIGREEKIVLDLSVALEWARELDNKTGAEFVDLVFGEGFYAKVKAATPGVLSFTVGDLVTVFKTNGGSIDELEDAIDALIVLMGAPEGMTLKSLIASEYPEFEGDLEDLLAMEEIASVSLNLLPYLFGSTSPDNEVSTARLCLNCYNEPAIGTIDIDGNVVDVCGTCYKEYFNSYDLEKFEVVEESEKVEEEPEQIKTLQQILDDVFVSMEAASFADLMGLSADDLSVIETSIQMAISSVAIEAVVDADGIVKSVKYKLDMSAVQEGSMVMDMNAERTADGAVIHVDTKMGGVTLAKGDIEIKKNASGFYSKDALDSIKKVSGYIDVILADSDLGQMLMDSTHAEIKSHNYIVEDGETVGITFETDYGYVYEVYYEDVIGYMTTASGELGVCQVMFAATLIYTNEYYDGDVLVNMSETDAVTLNVNIYINMQTGEVIDLSEMYG